MVCFSAGLDFSRMHPGSRHTQCGARAAIIISLSLGIVRSLDLSIPSKVWYDAHTGGPCPVTLCFIDPQMLCFFFHIEGKTLHQQKGYDSPKAQMMAGIFLFSNKVFFN